MKQDFEMQPGKPTCLPQNGAISQGKSSSKHFFQGMRSVSHMFPIYFWLAWRQVCFFCAICVFFSETTDKHLHLKNMCFWWSFVRQKCQKRFRCQQSERILQGGPPASYNPSYPFIRPFTDPFATGRGPPGNHRTFAIGSMAGYYCRGNGQTLMFLFLFDQCCFEGWKSRHLNFIASKNMYRSSKNTQR